MRLAFIGLGTMGGPGSITILLIPVSGLMHSS